MTFPFGYRGVGTLADRQSVSIQTDCRFVKRSARALMKPATDRPADKRLEKGQETRRAIIDTATRLFAEHGYAAVSIEAVLAACQISRGALYHHFSSKEALLEAVFEAV